MVHVWVGHGRARSLSPCALKYIQYVHAAGAWRGRCEPLYTPPARPLLSTRPTSSDDTTALTSPCRLTTKWRSPPRHVYRRGTLAFTWTMAMLFSKCVWLAVSYARLLTSRAARPTTCCSMFTDTS